ncbi:HAD family hydrolase [Promicromonospora iranensis]|uniref:HAD superfamily hydrolase (TIGR01484 family) n=1 Tax=Promicromonospora iranensis TaxID=1105144 RepID=A0ABU2CIL4_9MICO|nr:HAD family hydrolase [Promicromonospora iranensis]MDR7381166.1 HAD superfamily hydrolase (TIGR01484 family) [Promicromonospora iranensis]
MTTTHDRSRRRSALIALDIDGTIAHPGTTEISDAVRAAVADVLAAGHHVVLATGRSLVGVLPVARLLQLAEGWIVASNGAVTARIAPQASGGYQLHNVQTFDPRPVVRRARSAYPGVQIAAEEVGRGYRVTRMFAPSEVNGAQRHVDADQIADRPTTRLILRSPGITALRHKLQAGGVTVNPYGPNWLDVTPPHLSKATALENIRTLLDVHERRTTALGDGVNDIEMLTWANRGVAMGHAPAEVLAAAGDVTATLAEDGAAAVLRSLLPETIPAVR